MATRTDPDARRAYSRWHYQQNRATYKARAKEQTTKTRAEVRDIIRRFLADHPCIDCGEPDPIVLEFDHRPGEAKAFNLGNAISKGYSAKSVETEIAKCDVRCANCHRRVTYHRAGREHRS